jgi:hypothetical protein
VQTVQKAIQEPKILQPLDVLLPHWTSSRRWLWHLAVIATVFDNRQYHSRMRKMGAWRNTNFRKKKSKSSPERLCSIAA